MKRLFAFLPLAVLLAIVLAGLTILVVGKDDPLKEGLVGKPAPTFTLARLEGGPPVAPGEFAGKPYLINFFASWCAPCRVEHPLLMQLSEEGVPILGVAYKDAPEDAARFLEAQGSPFRSVGLDPNGRLALELGISGVPETYVVGADGKLRYLYRGPLTEEIVETGIRPALR